jgi:hypothetical protein
VTPSDIFSQAGIPSPITATPKTTTVKASPGDTLSGIAKANGTTVAQILTDNPTLAARAAAGTTVLFNQTGVKITAPNTATNPYGANQSGQGAGLGTASVPISSVNSVLTPKTSAGGFSTTGPFNSNGGIGNTPYGPNAIPEVVIPKEEIVTPVDTTPYFPYFPTVNAVPASAPIPAAAPVTPPIKTAPIDTVLFNDDSIDSQLYLDLLFENIGGQELLAISRYDTVNGQSVKYQPIKNLGLIQQEYNPHNLVKLQQTSLNIFDNFSIKLNDKIPILTNDPSGNNANVWVDVDGSIMIELVNMVNDEQIEVQVAYNGTIYEAGI